MQRSFGPPRVAAGFEARADQALRRGGFMKGLPTGNRRQLGMFIAWVVGATASALAAGAPTITYQPYVEPGDASRLEDSDQLVIAWQTDEAIPNPAAFAVDFGRSHDYGRIAMASGRVVDNYLAADRTLPVPPTAPGPRVNYT